MVARRGAGKTSLARDIVYELAARGELDGGVLVFSPTAGLSGDWDSIGRAHDFSEDNLQWYIRAQSARVRAAKERGLEAPHLLIVFDDQNERAFHDSEGVRWLYANGRHLGVSVLTLCQFPTMLSPAARNNLDALFIGGQAGDGLRGLYPCVAWSGDYKAFEGYITEQTREFGFASYVSRDASWETVRAVPRRYRLR